MPLHLLGKKSWNVYNPNAIAKVRADEAAHAAREEAQNELELAYQADVRLAQLRGLPEPPRPAELDVDLDAERDAGSKRRLEGKEEDAGRVERRLKRRRPGEDDTDRDLRVARQEMEGKVERISAGRSQRREKEKDDALPLVGEDGHIQLFAPASLPASPAYDSRKKNPEQLFKEKQREEFEGGAMRFDAAGSNRSNPATKPWYAGVISRSAHAGISDQQHSPFMEEVGRDVWGNEDVNRKARDAARISTADPMAMMQMAQRKLKAVEREREMWKKEREVEVGDGHDIARRERHSRDHDDGSGRRHRSHRRSRSRSRSPGRRHSRKHDRSRSRDRDRGHRHQRHAERRSDDNERELHRRHQSSRA